MSFVLKAMEWIWPGDWLVRAAITRLNAQRLRQLKAGGVEQQYQRRSQLMQQLAASPRALVPQLANQQHYEVPAEFFQKVLGPHLKYSCGLWGPGVADLAQAEESMLSLYLERAQLEDGQRILDLGCGWGSLSLFLAQRFPNSRILGVSNSRSQRDYILQQAQLRGLTNLEVLTCDINQLELPESEFDRILSIEMLEHVRNYGQVLQLLHQALRPKGKLFVHVFAHIQHPYTFDPRGESGVGGDWMEKEFFSGGTMPSPDLMLYFQGALKPEADWIVNGQHYARTAQAWLAGMRQNRVAIVAIFKSTYGRAWRRYWLGWQLFFLACQQLFGHSSGEEWVVLHRRWSRL